MPTVVFEQDVTLHQGQHADYRLSPPADPSCRVIFELRVEGESEWHVMSGANVAGDPVPPADVGNFDHTGHATGRLSLRAPNGPARGRLRITVICPQEGHGPYEIVDSPVPIPKPAGDGGTLSAFDPLVELLGDLGTWIWDGFRFLLLPATIPWFLFWRFLCWLAEILARMGFTMFLYGAVEDPPSGSWWEGLIPVERLCWLGNLVGPLLPDALKKWVRKHGEDEDEEND